MLFRYKTKVSKDFQSENCGWRRTVTGGSTPRPFEFGQNVILGLHAGYTRVFSL